MKQISIVINCNDNDTLAKNLINNLDEVFEGKIKINVLYLNMIPFNVKIDSKVVLVMSKLMVHKVKNLVDNQKNIIIASRTFSEKSLYKIYSIPNNTNVLVVNDSYDSSNETVALLYQLGIKHINLIAYNEDKVDTSKFNIAITPGESNRVPKSIKNIIDIGHRKFDMQTFLNILNLLDFQDNEINERLVRYTHTIVEINTGVRKRYIESYVLSETLKNIIQLSHEGMLVVNTEFNTVYYNKKLEEILGCKVKVGENINKYIYDMNCNLILSKTFTSDLIQENNQHLIVTKTPLYVFDEIMGYYLNFNTATNINEKGSELSKKLYKSGLFARYSFEDIIYKSEKMKICIGKCKKIAKSDYTVLINGRSGTGKELIAQSIHNYSYRKNKPFVAINCAALLESLLESELFGYEGGAFTGSKKEGKLGLFEQANRGTIFLDEIGDMPLSLQSRLLRVIQEKQIMRLGSNNIIDIDVRIITATNKDLQNEVEHGRFREDLYYRLNVLPIELPVLSERKEDILPIFYSFIGMNKKFLTDEMEKIIYNYDWPGNIRELKNVAEYFILMKNVDNIKDKITFKSRNEINRKTIDAFYTMPDTDEVIIEVLGVISTYSKLEMGIGRNKIISELTNKNIHLSEKKTEKILSYFIKNEFITRKKGRAGIRITEKGYNYYRRKLDN